MNFPDKKMFFLFHKMNTLDNNEVYNHLEKYTYIYDNIIALFFKLFFYKMVKLYIILVRPVSICRHDELLHTYCFQNT